MMKMMKKTIPFLLAAMSLLSACTGGTGPETSPAKPAGETVSGAPSGSAELVGAPEAAEEKEGTKQNVPGGGDSVFIGQHTDVGHVISPLYLPRARFRALSSPFSPEASPSRAD